MAIEFETYLDLAEAARLDKSLHQNHLESSSVVPSLKKRKLENEDLLNRLIGTQDDNEIVDSLQRENHSIDHALTAYVPARLQREPAGASGGDGQERVTFRRMN